MTTTWYFMHAGATHGPFSTAELRRRAAAGFLGPDDLVWSRDGGPQRAVVAGAALALPGRVAEARALPDWLADVQGAEQAAAHTGPPKPDWLEDVRCSEVHDRPQGPPRLAVLARLLRRWFRGSSPDAAP